MVLSIYFYVAYYVLLKCYGHSSLIGSLLLSSRYYVHMPIANKPRGT